MKVLFIAGFGPVASDVEESRRLYEDALGLAFKIEDGEYRHTEELAGANTFAVWPLSQAAESCFGSGEWPGDVPRPQAWLEFDVDDVDAATRGLEGRGYRLLVRVVGVARGRGFVRAVLRTVIVPCRAIAGVGDASGYLTVVGQMSRHG